MIQFRFRPRFSLKTLFVGVTLICVWLGYQLNWIRQRHEACNEFQAEAGFAAYNGKSIPPVTAPAFLWLLGERGYKHVWIPTSVREVTPEEKASFNRFRRLFPEAEIRQHWRDERSNGDRLRIWSEK